MTDNHKKKTEFSVYLAFYLVIIVLMITSGFTTTAGKANAATSSLPTCTDPTWRSLAAHAV